MGYKVKVIARYGAGIQSILEEREENCVGEEGRGGIIIRILKVMDIDEERSKFLSAIFDPEESGRFIASKFVPGSLKGKSVLASIKEILRQEMASEKTLESGRFKLHHLIASELIRLDDITSFRKFLILLQKSDINLLKVYNNRGKRIEGQIDCPTMNLILELLAAERKSATTTQTRGKREVSVDYVNQILKGMFGEKIRSKPLGERFDQDTLDSLDSQKYQKRFTQIMKEIDGKGGRLDNESNGRQVLEAVKRYYRLSMFKETMADNISSVILGRSADGGATGIAQVTRYVNAQFTGGDRAYFNELPEFDGLKIIFNAVNEVGWNALFYAIMSNEPDAVKIILKIGMGNLFHKDTLDYTALHLLFMQPEELDKYEEKLGNKVEALNVFRDDGDKKKTREGNKSELLTIFLKYARNEIIKQAEGDKRDRREELMQALQLSNVLLDNPILSASKVPTSFAQFKELIEFLGGAWDPRDYQTTKKEHAVKIMEESLSKLIKGRK